MAQSSKSRIVIWTIVGILVVVAAVMLVTKPKNSGKPPVNPGTGSRGSFEGRFQKLEAESRRCASPRIQAPRPSGRRRR